VISRVGDVARFGPSRNVQILTAPDSLFVDSLKSKERREQEFDESVEREMTAIDVNASSGR